LQTQIPSFHFKVFTGAVPSAWNALLLIQGLKNPLPSFSLSLNALFVTGDVSDLQSQSDLLISVSSSSSHSLFHYTHHSYMA